MKRYIFIIACFIVLSLVASSQSVRNYPLYPTYKGLVMCGYQGWFRAEGDATDQGWVHYGSENKFDTAHLTIDLWPDMSEYEKSYPASFIESDGSPARVFSSADESTTDVHFRWMKEYGIDGVFVQRFYSYCRNEKARKIPDIVLGNALKASQKYERAIAVMYDLSGLRPNDDDCSLIIEDWKHLCDDLKVKNYGAKQTYLYHNQKPLVAIWGLGFPDRPYNIRDIGIDKLIDFLKNDPEYGGCSLMLGVPTYFRELDSDCLPDTYLHDLIRSADIVMPWMVGRFTLNIYNEMNMYATHIKKDIAWCKENGVDYSPCVYPGFSWYNMHKGSTPLDQIPRYKGKFIWSQISTAIDKGADMLYVAMFDEIDEGTAIFKCTNNPPVNAAFVTYEGLPTDYYLKLVGMAGKMLRKEIPFSDELYKELYGDCSAEGKK
ncbi:MAG: xylosidase [Bacteroidales bacterium]|nr:xylosidase [Bacteroidales bacterium]